jgi:uncharacterized delta-60 repeat protein
MKNKNTLLGLTVGLLTTGMALTAQTPGTPNALFGNQGELQMDLSLGASEHGNDVLVQPDGKIVLAITQQGANNTSDFGLLRLNPDGSLDNTFNFDGKYPFNMNDVDISVAVAQQSDGKTILLGHTDNGSSGVDIVLHRVTASGLPDNTFGTNGTVVLDRSFGGDDFGVDLVVMPDDRIMMAGSFVLNNEYYYLVYKLLANGQVDSSFTSDGNIFFNQNTGVAILSDMEIAPNGAIYLSGGILDGSVIKGQIYKLNANGFLDNSFSTDGIRTFTTGIGRQNLVGSLKIRPDGKILGCGIEAITNSNDENAILFLMDTTGFFDASLNGVGYQAYGGALADEQLRKIDLLPDGKMVALGLTNSNGKSNSMLLQFNTDYTLDQNYGSLGGVFLDPTQDGNESFDFAMNNQFLYTAGYADAGSHDDIYVSSTHINNNIGLFENQQNLTAVHVFPNPIAPAQELNVELDAELQGNVQLQLTTMTGQTVLEKSYYKFMGLQTQKLALGALPRGAYLLTVVCNGKTGVQKVMVQ